MTDGAELSPTGLERAPSARSVMSTFWVAVGLSIVLPRIPFGRFVLYPFALLGTWAHEMGHGLVGLAVGGSFERLEVYRGLGGVAFVGGVGSVGTVLVSLGGLLGPAVLGALVIVYGARPATARWVLAAVACGLVASVLLFVRNGFGLGALGLLGGILAIIGFRGPDQVRVAVAQLLGIQLCLASWGSLDYLFTRGFVRDGQRVDSDTQNIAEVLLLPYWFWGAIVAALSLAILGAAFYRAWIRPLRSSPSTA